MAKSIKSGKISEAPDSPESRPGKAFSFAASELFATSFHQAPIGIALLDPSGRWLQVNDAVCEIVGYTREELLQRTFQDITHPADLEKDLQLVDDVLAGRRNGYQLEKRYLRKDGRHIWAQLTVTLVRNPDQSPFCFISHIEDISRAVEDREKLRKLSERLQLATSAARIGVIDYDLTQKLAFWDDRMFSIYGLEPTRDGLMDLPSWAACVHPEDFDKAMAALPKTLADGSPLDITFRILHPVEGVKTVRVNAHIVRDADGNPSRCIAVTHDVTEQTQASAELRAAKDAADAANRAKSAFLAMMSHEIRTPLHGIIGHTHLLADRGVPPELNEHLSTIITSGESLLTIIEDILDYSKIEAGKLHLEKAAFSLRQCVNTSVEMLMPRVSAKRIVLTAQVDPAVPEVVVGDQIRLRQVLGNLLSNAVKFTIQGEVSLRVTSEVISRESVMLHFRISDTGIGIPRERLEDLFQPFNQLDSSVTRRFGGTGLGLAICHGLVSSMEGKIELTSQESAGTEVHVSLPMEVAPEGTEPEGAHLRTASERNFAQLGGFQSLPRHLAGLRVLVAEDNPTNSRLMQQILRKIGITQLEVVSDGLEVIEHLTSKPVDVILMDCQMPLMDGYETTREIRRLEQADPRRKKAYIIAVTAGAFREDRDRAFEAGMDDFVTKPLRPETLNEALACFLVI